MEFQINKNKNKNGFFRINLKKTGVEYSLGLPGYTFTRTSKGSTKKHKSIRKKSKNYDNITQNTTLPFPSFQPVEYQVLINKISSLIKINYISTWLCVIWTIFLFPIILINHRFLTYLFSALLMLTCTTGIIMKLYAHIWGRVNLTYELDNATRKEHEQRISAWAYLNKSQYVWQELIINKVDNSKENGGQHTIPSRHSIKLKSKIPFYLKTNVSVLQLQLKHETILLLPEKLLIVRKSKVGAIKHTDIVISTKVVHFMETDTVPKDTEIEKYTWKYVNKDGSPDKRYKNNIKYPICNYGHIHLQSDCGLSIALYCSNVISIRKLEVIDFPLDQANEI